MARLTDRGRKTTKQQLSHCEQSVTASLAATHKTDSHSVSVRKRIVIPPCRHMTSKGRRTEVDARSF